jgi:ectoine hydroxylase-related dioxygenase (phytanoyl-CoA dioxygenase family)
VNTTIRTYGVTSTAPIQGSLGLPLEELSRVGYTVLEEILPQALVVAMKTALDRILADQTARFGAARMQVIGDANIARALLEEDAVFLEILRLPVLDEIVETLLSPAALVMQQNGIVIPGGGASHVQQSWHRDLPYQSWVATKPLSLGALLALDDFTAQSGATLFLPGSHRDAAFPSEDFVARWATPVFAPSGSVIVFDSMVFHRGGVNLGALPRRAVNTIFAVPILAQQVTFTAKSDIDGKLQRRLGLDYKPAASADAWREQRAARRSKAKQ